MNRVGRNPNRRLWVGRRYLVATFVVNLIWESLQLPLYTLWVTGTPQKIIFAIAHCTAGDVAIAGLSLFIAASLFGRASWPNANAAPVFLANLILGLGYTVFSEWLNTSVRGNWAYSHWMPVLPFIGTGLAPLIQWLAVPTVALRLAIGRTPWIDAPNIKLLGQNS